jgi:hypothetical protein
MLCEVLLRVGRLRNRNYHHCKHGLTVATQDQGLLDWFEANELLSDADNHHTDGAEFKDWRLPTRR